MLELLILSNYLLFLYYFLSNMIYLGLLLLALRSSRAHQERLRSVQFEKVKASPFVPTIAILVPAHNEEKTIAESVRSLLALDYPQLEVIVVNDGSQDGTLRALVREFRLLPTDVNYPAALPTRKVRGLFMSRSDPRLIVVDKEAGGSKSDAINAGLNAASSHYVCVVDADAILERDALLRMVTVILPEEGLVAAAGGIVRPVNGCRVEHGRLTEVRLAQRPLEVLQVIEYLRAFLIGREGWAYFNLLLIISGAFGVFRRDLVMRVGGYKTSAIGEDLDVVVRMHRWLRENQKEYSIRFVPDPVCWTEVPADRVILARQRARWQKGLLDVMWGNKDMLFNPRYGRIGLVAVPYQWVFELLAPVIEVVGYTTMILAAILGELSMRFFILFLLFGYAFATLLSIGSVFQEEITYRRFPHTKDVARLILYCFLEHFPYRQLQMWWRLKGLVQYIRGDMHWGRMERTGFQKAGSAA